MPTILTKKKDTTGAPAPGDLTNSAGGAELAVNTFDKRLYTKDAGGNVVEIGTNPSTIDTTTVDTTNLEVTNIKAKDGTASATIANSTGVMTIGSSVLTTTDINGGTIDGTTIGASTASTGKFSTLTNAALTSGRVTYATTGGLLTDSANMTFNGTGLTLANDASISGLTVGKGGGAVVGNTAIGLTALAGSNTGTGFNTAVGYLAMTNNTSGQENTAVGVYSLPSNTTGSYNTAIGRSALSQNTTASNNTAVGYQAGYSVTTPANQTFVGYQAGYSRSTGNDNFSTVMIGNLAGYSTTTGIDNTYIGGYAARFQTGSTNTAIGGGALYGTNGSSTGSNNTAVGYQAGYSNTTGGQLTALGRLAAYGNTTGLYTVAIGSNALANNSTGNSNTAVGTEALQANTTASNNTAVGYQAGYSNTTGAGIAFAGYQAGYSNTTGATNNAFGGGALYTNSVGNQNNAFGYFALNAATGTGNTAFGHGAGYLITTGAKNTILGTYNGNQGGLDIRTASNYIVLSDGDGNPRQVIDGSGNVGIGTSSPSASYRLSVVGSGIYTNGSTNDFGSGLYPFVRVNATANNAIFGFILDGTQGGTYNGRDWRVEQGRNAVGNFNITEIAGGNPIRLSINGSGNVGLSGSNASADGVGICFPATQSASSDANTLDDYEEGTFSPTDVSGAGLTFSASGGTYTKIGRFVLLTIRVVYPSTANGSAAKIGNFPFANGGANTGGFLVGSDCALNLNFRIDTTTSTHISSGGTFTAVTNAQLSAKEVQFTFIYTT